jgi:TatD DNase family protein
MSITAPNFLVLMLLCLQVPRMEDTVLDFEEVTLVHSPGTRTRSSTPTREEGEASLSLNVSIIEPHVAEASWLFELPEEEEEEGYLSNGDDKNILVIDELRTSEEEEEEPTPAVPKITPCPLCRRQSTSRQRHLKSHLPWYVIPSRCCWECQRVVSQPDRFWYHRKFHGCSEGGQYSPQLDMTRWAQLMTGLLIRICYLLGLPGIAALYQFFRHSHSLHPDPRRTTLDSDDISWIREFEVWLRVPDAGESPSVDPPNRMGLLTHWRVIFNMLKLFTEEQREELRATEDLADVWGYTVLTTPEPPTGACVDSHFHHDRLISRSGCPDWDQLKASFVRDEQLTLDAAVTCCAFPEDWPRSDQELHHLLTQRQPTITVTVGWHPTRSDVLSAHTLQRFEELVAKPWCVAAGELGLDYHRGSTEKQRRSQRVLLRRVLPVIVKAHTPVVIHCRDAERPDEASAHRDCLAILERELPRTWPVYIHCFNGGTDQAKDWIQTFPNVRFGISPLLCTKRKHPELRSVIQRLDARQILLESDSPYFLKDASEFPCDVAKVAREIATIRQVPVSQIARASSEATQMFYRAVAGPY